jgi:hypothetical protein
MPIVQAGSSRLHYGQQGAGEPLVLIPYLAADHAYRAFQVPEYPKYFNCRRSWRRSVLRPRSRQAG